MFDILLFAGTEEGRTLAGFLKNCGRDVLVLTATRYGADRIEPGVNLTVEEGRLDESEMADVIRSRAAAEAVVVDATHPYAVQASENIRKACRETGRTYLRIYRESTLRPDSSDVLVSSPAEAAVWLKEHPEGKVLLTTGSKELPEFTSVPGFPERFYARILPMTSNLEICEQLSLPPSHLICMQGPFSEEMNIALIRQTGASVLVTKDTGTAGGFNEKKTAADKCGCRLLIIGRPSQEQGISESECLEILKNKFPDLSLAEKKQEAIDAADKADRRIAVIGIGMGSRDCRTMTQEAAEYCRHADLLIGAGRMLEAVAAPGQRTVKEYRPEEVSRLIREDTKSRQIAVLLSGDVGFFSGAKKLLRVLPEQTEVMSGISSLIYFCGKLRESWDDVCITSSHGRDCNLIGEICRNQKVFSILGTRDAVRNLCRSLLDYGMTDLRIDIGENLSYPEEKVLHGAPEDFADYSGSALSVLLVHNPKPDCFVTQGIPDESFERDKVPMTKEEIREISVSKLRLTDRSVVYDVGAGSGSVSVETALRAREGKVFAIEKNPVAVQLLHRNRKKFRADNLQIVEGLAPEALEDLPAPTHAFIGGSSGNLKDILRLLLKKNPCVRVVINCITLETVGEALDAMKTLPLGHTDIVSVSVARAKKAGPYHMMMGQNPVYILSADGVPDGQQE